MGSTNRGGGGGAAIAEDLGGTTEAPTVEGLQGEDLPDSVGGTLIKRNAGNTAWETVAYSGSNLTTDLSGKAASSHTHAEGDLALTDVTTANATTSLHGLAPKASAPASGLLSVLAIGNGETVRTDKALFDTTNPADLGVAAPGTSLVAARRDHVHAAPASGTDITGMTGATDYKVLTDYVPVYDASAAANRKFLFSDMISGRNALVIAEDCFAKTQLSGGLVAVQDGASSTINYLSVSGHPGVIIVRAVTTSGAGFWSPSASLHLAGAKSRFCAIIKTPAALSDGTNTYTIRVGCNDSGYTADSTEGLEFKYSHGVNSGKWQLVSNSGATPSVSDTLIAVAASTWYTLEWTFDGTTIQGFVNGAAAGAAIITNLPTAAATGLLVGLDETVGTAERDMLVDFIGLTMEFATAR